MDHERHGRSAHRGDEQSDGSRANPSGAPEAGGATTPGSQFGGESMSASFLRAIARVARSVEAAAYRRLRDLDRSAGEPTGARGRPNRVREAGDTLPRRPQPV